MKKSTIWLLASVMAFAFFGLLYLQITYFQTTIQLRNDQFNEAVSRSLYQVSTNLEIGETKKYLNDGLQAQAKRRSRQFQEKTITQHQRLKIQSPDGEDIAQVEINASQIVRTRPSQSVYSSPQGSNAVSRTSYEMQELLKERYEYQRKLIDDVIYELVHTSSSVPIEERINYSELDASIRSELKHNGIELPFQFEVVDKNDKSVFKEIVFKETDDRLKRNSTYSQILFPNDPINSLHNLRVYFPDKGKYLFSEITFLFPSLIFTCILLATFIISIYLIFRQKRLSEMKSDFMNNMTHELKTPVSTISLAAQMLKDISVAKSPETFKHISGVISDEAKRLSFQVEKVLQMSLFDKQKATLNLKEMDINDVAASVANTFQIKVEKFGGHIDIDLEATESAVKVDEMHFTNVLFNLSDNAVKYKKEEVPLELMIRTWNANKKVYISVEDNGIGMKKDDLRKIFDQFFRIHTGNRHDVKVFGLGLAYVKKIIEDHKGTIKVESELGKGTKFIICLPTIK